MLFPALQLYFLHVVPHPNTCSYLNLPACLSVHVEPRARTPNYIEKLHVIQLYGTFLLEFNLIMWLTCLTNFEDFINTSDK